MNLNDEILNEILKSFTLNNREISTLLFISAIFLYILKDKNFRRSTLESVIHILKLVKSKLGILFLIESIAIFYILKFLYHLNLWNFIQTKDTFIWFIFAGLAAPFNFLNSKNKSSFFKVYIKGLIKLAILMEFLLNFYTFPLLVELIIVPIITFIVCCKTYAETRNDYKNIVKLFEYFQIFIGINMGLYNLMSVLNESDIKEMILTYRNHFKSINI